MIQKNIRNNSCTDILGKYVKSHDEEFRPLSKKEEEALIEKFRNDPDEIRKQLIQHNLRLVFSMAKKYAASSSDFDELIGRGIEGLVTAAERFDLNRKIKFVTYATPWIFKFIQKEFSQKEFVLSKSRISLYTPITDSDGDSVMFGDVLNSFVKSDYLQNESALSVTDQLDQRDLQTVCQDVCRFVQADPSFDDLDREIFQKNLLEKTSIKQLSVDLNVQYPVLGKKKREVLEKLQEYLKEKYGEESFSEFLPTD